jgi:hypothetical protein
MNIYLRTLMENPRRSLGLILFGALGSALVSSSIGASILDAGNVRGWSGFGPAWLWRSRFQQLAGSFANYATRRNRVSFAKRSEQFFSLFRSGRKRRVCIPPK